MKIRITNKKVPKAEFGIPGPPKPFDYQGGMKKLLGTFDGMAQPSYGYKPMGLPERPAYQQQELKFDPKPGMNKILGTFDPYAPLFSGAPATKSKIGYTPKGLPSRESITGTGVEQPKYDPWREDLASGVFAFKGMLTGANAITDFINDQRQQRNFNRAMIDDRLGGRAMAPTSGSRGDYTVNEGLFRPDDTYVPNKGMFANQYYPSVKVAQVGGGVIPEEPLIPFDIIDYEPGSAEILEASSAPNVKSSKSSSANPMAEQTWEDISSTFEGVSNKGIWGDTSHKKRKSDHNTGDALDIGIKSTDQGDKITDMLIQQAKDRNVKYVIFNRRIWSPDKGWREYVPSPENGNNPHTDHVHVSFNRMTDDNEQPKPKGTIAVTHNNPGNIHYGDFAKQWNVTKGAYDNNGYVAKFQTIEDGMEAMQQLLFGPKYSNLTISQARNKWVNGKTDMPSESTPQIVKAMGGKDLMLNQMTPEQQKKLMGEFIKFEDRQMFNILKEKKLYELGGEQENPTIMKIRITKDPNQEMEYGGQMGYGLDLNRRKVYTDMPESMSDTVTKTMSEDSDPEEPYQLEAEGGETIMHPDGSHYTITGDRHHSGGVKLTGTQAPEGSFIFSDTAKMRLSGPILKMFGKSEDKKYTPAQIAKQYDVNKYLAILKDKNSDPLRRDTAKMMVENYQKKLGGLALLQESKKGFRDGIPQVAFPYLQSIMDAMPQQTTQSQGFSDMSEAKYGGYLQRFQIGNEVKTVAQKAKDRKEIEGWKLVGKDSGRTYYEKNTKVKDAIPGTPGSAISVRQAIPGGKAGTAWEKFIIDQLQKGVTIEELAAKKHGTIAGLQRYKQYYKPVPGTSGTPEEWRKDYRYIEDDPVNPTGGTTDTNTPGTTTSDNSGPKPGNPGQMQSSSYPSRWMTPDKVNMLASMALPPKKFLPFIPAMNIQTPQPVFEDWRAKAAARQAMYNTAARTMGNYGPTQGLAANLSFMAGQQGDPLIQDIAQTEARNVAVANQFSPMIAETANKMAEYEAKRKQSLYDGNVVANQQYRNSWRDYMNKNARTFGQGWNNAAMLAAMNATNENFQIDPRSGRVMFRNLGDPFSTGNSPKSTGLTQQQYLDALKALKDKGLGLSDDQVNTALRIQYPQLAAMTGSRGNSASQLALLEKLFGQQQ